MTYDIESVRRIETSPTHPAYINENRTDAQKHTDHGLDGADQAIAEAVYSFNASLAWAASIGVEIPARVRGVETILRQWQTHLADERKRRG